MNQPLIVSTRKGLFILEHGPAGSGWSIVHKHFLGDRVSLAFADPNDHSIYAALDHGHFGIKLHRSDDRGQTFREIAAPAFPPKPEELDDVDGAKRDVNWSVSLIWALESAGSDRAGQLWAGTIPGGLFHSADRGESWKLCEALWNEPRRRNWFGGGADAPGIHSIAIDPRDSNRVLVGVSCGGVWQTIDGGESWQVCAKGMRADFMPPERAHDQTIQDPHCVVMCPSSPEILWSQHHCGIYKSTDGAKTWSEIKEAGPSTFGFPVVVHPTDPQTAWFVPAVSDEHRIPVDGKLVVTRTRDGGASFDTLSAGLPSENAYDIVFRHGLDIDRDGESLAFGTTTGSLFYSADQGDSWQAVSCHLPPIYAVRFGKVPRS